MKTIQVCIGLFMLATIPFGCSEDDAVADIIVPDAEETGTFLEQDLHLLYLRRQYDLIAEDIAVVEEELANDPDNQDFLAQLEELEANREMNTQQIIFLNAQIEEVLSNQAVRPKVPRLGPLPPPPMPCTCFSPLDLTRLQEVLLIGNTEGFSATVFSENQEVIEEFGNISEFEDTGIPVISIGLTLSTLHKY